MKMPTLAPSEVRTVSIAGIAIVLSLSYVFGIKPYRAALANARASLESERNNLVKERIQVASAKNNPLLIQAVDSAMKAFAPRLFDAGSEVAATADLTTYVAGLARDNHVFITGSQTQKPVVSPSGVRTLRADIHAESDLRGILGFLEAVDHGDRLVTVERWELQRPAAAEDNDVETLTLNMTVNGFMVGDPPQPAAKPGAPGVPAAPGAAKAPAPAGRGTK
jgi:hypothetical protein